MYCHVLSSGNEVTATISGLAANIDCLGGIRDKHLLSTFHLDIHIYLLQPTVLTTLSRQAQ